MIKTLLTLQICCRVTLRSTVFNCTTFPETAMPVNLFHGDISFIFWSELTNNHTTEFTHFSASSTVHITYGNHPSLLSSSAITQFQDLLSGALNTQGVENFDFREKSPFISETVQGKPIWFLSKVKRRMQVAHRLLSVTKTPSDLERRLWLGHLTYLLSLHYLRK